MTTSKVDVTTSENNPITTAQITDNSPITTSEVPMTTSEVDVTTSENNPITSAQTTDNSPITTSEAPITTLEVDATTSENNPIMAAQTTNNSPITTSETPVTTLEVDATTSENTPITTAQTTNNSSITTPKIIQITSSKSTDNSPITTSENTPITPTHTTDNFPNKISESPMTTSKFDVTTSEKTPITTSQTAANSTITASEVQMTTFKTDTTTAENYPITKSESTVHITTSGDTSSMTTITTSEKNEIDGFNVNLSPSTISGASSTTPSEVISTNSETTSTTKPAFIGIEIEGFNVHLSPVTEASSITTTVIIPTKPSHVVSSTSGTTSTTTSGSTENGIGGSNVHLSTITEVSSITTTTTTTETIPTKSSQVVSSTSGITSTTTSDSTGNGIGGSNVNLFPITEASSITTTETISTKPSQVVSSTSGITSTTTSDSTGNGIGGSNVNLFPITEASSITTTETIFTKPSQVVSSTSAIYSTTTSESTGNGIGGSNVNMSLITDASTIITTVTIPTKPSQVVSSTSGITSTTTSDSTGNGNGGSNVNLSPITEASSKTTTETISTKPSQVVSSTSGITLTTTSESTGNEIGGFNVHLSPLTETPSITTTIETIPTKPSQVVSSTSGTSSTTKPASIGMGIWGFNVNISPITGASSVTTTVTIPTKPSQVVSTTSGTTSTTTSTEIGIGGSHVHLSSIMISEASSTTTTATETITSTASTTISSIDYCESLSVVGPKVVRRNTPFTVVVSNSRTRRVELVVSLIGTYSNTDAYNKTATIVVPNNAVKTASFEIANIPEGMYSLMFTNVNEDCVFDERVDLVYNPKALSIFIQTDKPMYNPENKVRFRIIVVDIDTKPISNRYTAEVQLSDARGNFIMQWSHVTIVDGIFSSDYPLAASPILGNWSLTATIDGIVAKKQFEVRQYELPKFFVKAYPTEVSLIKNKRVKVTVEAAYTFGQQIEGAVRIALFLSQKRTSAVATATKNIIGKTNVEFPLKKEIVIEEKSADFQDVVIKVSVAERYTNRTVNITQTIPVFLYPYKISVVKPLPALHPGVPYAVQFSIKDHYGDTPVNPKSLEITAYYGGEEANGTDTFKQSLTKQGATSLYMNPPRDCTELTLMAKYESINYGILETIKATKSQSLHYIRVSINPKYRIRVNKDVVFSVSCTRRMKYFSYIITSRGRIIASSTNLSVSNKKRINIKIKLTPRMAPVARIIVFDNDDEFVLFDQLDLHFESFNNNVMMALDSEEYQPGQDIYVNVAAAEDSYFGTQAIDQSVLLLGNNANAFDKNEVLKDLALYDYTGNNDINSFASTGLFLLSTSQTDTPMLRTGPMGRAKFFSEPYRQLEKPVLIRTEFPDSWLWKNFTLNARKTTVNDTVPDTITSWQVSGFALSPSLGLGFVDKPQNLVVIQPFYIIVQQPYSVKRNEITLVHVTVYNHHEETISANVTLSSKRGEIEFVGVLGGKIIGNLKKRITVPTDVGRSVTFMIKAKKLGDIAIKAQAKSLLASDAVEHILRVTPENHLYEKNEARVIELNIVGTQKFTIDLDIPRGIEEGSLSTKFTVDGNFLGTAVNNLESLIRLPTGNGESNMVSFVTSIVVLDYLSETGTIANDVKSKAINSLQVGYQNQLKYKRSDGSFSLWGRRNLQGSTFLTAFVAKSFKLASKYIVIDESIISAAFHWLADVQSSDGRFEEVGQMSHPDIQGGLRNNSIALTSYVLIALLEDAEIASMHNSTVRRATRFLSRKFHQKDDVYDLALITYAFSLAKHPKAKRSLDKLLENSEFMEGVGRYWAGHPFAVEVAGYAILSLLEQGIVSGTTSLVQWLCQNRYSRGGYSGTQNTFIGLKALAKFAATTTSQKNNYRITVWHKPAKKYTFNVNKTIAHAIQEVDLPSNIRQVRVKVEGKGYGVFQVACRYHMNIERAKPSFKLIVNVLKNTTYHVQYLRVCAKYIPQEAYQRSNTAMVEVSFPSGLVADEDSVQDLSPNRRIQKTELRYGATSINVYYDSLGPENSCFRVTAYRRLKVANNRPANVAVYDYHNPDRFAVKSYEGYAAQVCDICEEECAKLSCISKTKRKRNG
ncbi:thioester-containing protein 1 allele R1-like [Toxorhynchites rutilus septentrionalis]|uniref:thioester-containing protein 1 allele R1-like n=1 Tax=Toxorhynchites rutilus septentrionalis TaxID=329112 RepID=UPI002478BACB|nr:thioester-containing protein 1 allele R1-like [Toxorhynchites rutilus septentrionalis]